MLHFSGSLSPDLNSDVIAQLSGEVTWMLSVLYVIKPLFQCNWKSSLHRKMLFCCINQDIDASSGSLWNLHGEFQIRVGLGWFHFSWVPVLKISSIVQNTKLLVTLNIILKVCSPWQNRPDFAEFTAHHSVYPGCFWCLHLDLLTPVWLPFFRMQIHICLSLVWHHTHYRFYSAVLSI